jgi:Flp pilus assembly pilin Flp
VILVFETVKRFVRDEGGAGMFEYAILLGVGVAAAAVLGYALVPQIRNAVNRSASALSATAGW